MHTTLEDYGNKSSILTVHKKIALCMNESTNNFESMKD